MTTGLILTHLTSSGCDTHTAPDYKNTAILHYLRYRRYNSLCYTVNRNNIKPLTSFN